MSLNKEKLIAGNEHRRVIRYGVTHDGVNVLYHYYCFEIKKPYLKKWTNIYTGCLDEALEEYEEWCKIHPE